jgi:hypothetical protein
MAHCRSTFVSFHATRRTPGNLTVEIELDVGTWSSNLTAGFSVTGLGFTARLPLPVSKRATMAQYRIGGPTEWQQMGDNLSGLSTCQSSFLGV